MSHNSKESHVCHWLTSVSRYFHLMMQNCHFLASEKNCPESDACPFQTPAALYAKNIFRSQLAPGIFILVASNFIQEPIWILKFLFWSPATLFSSQKKYALYKCIYLYSIARGQLALENFFGGKPAIFFRSQLATMLLFSLTFVFCGCHWQPTARHVETLVHWVYSST